MSIKDETERLDKEQEIRDQALVTKPLTVQSQIAEFVEELVKDENIRPDQAAKMRAEVGDAVLGYDDFKKMRDGNVDSGLPDPDKLRSVIDLGQKLIDAMYNLPELYTLNYDLPYAPDSSDEAKVQRLIQIAETLLSSKRKPGGGRPTQYEDYFFVNCLLDIYKETTDKNPTIYSHKNTKKPAALVFVEDAYLLVDGKLPSIEKLKGIYKLRKARIDRQKNRTGH